MPCSNTILCLLLSVSVDRGTNTLIRLSLFACKKGYDNVVELLIIHGKVYDIISNSYSTLPAVWVLHFQCQGMNLLQATKMYLEK